MSIRLTDNDKASILEHDTQIPCEQFFTTEESAEFHEGVAAGLLLAVKIFGATTNGIDKVSASIITSVVAECIRKVKQGQE